MLYFCKFSNISRKRYYVIYFRLVFFFFFLFVSRQARGVFVIKEKKVNVKMVNVKYPNIIVHAHNRFHEPFSKGGDEILTGSFARIVPLLPRSGLTDLAESRQFRRQSGSDASQYITDLFNLQVRLARFANIQMAPLMEPSFHSPYLDRSCIKVVQRE